MQMLLLPTLSIVLLYLALQHRKYTKEIESVNNERYFFLYSFPFFSVAFLFRKKMPQKRYPTIHLYPFCLLSVFLPACLREMKEQNGS